MTAPTSSSYSLPCFASDPCQQHSKQQNPLFFRTSPSHSLASFHSLLLLLPTQPNITACFPLPFHLLQQTFFLHFYLITNYIVINSYYCSPTFIATAHQAIDQGSRNEH